MAETIINSNQLRQSGDTSSQTLIGANQIRQSGDSSSQTLLNKNQIASSSGTLNAEIVGTPTISDDFILSNFDNSNYLKFNPANPSGDTFTFVTKFKVGDLTKKGLLFMCQPDKTGLRISYGDDGSGQGGISFLLTDQTGNRWTNDNGQSRFLIFNVYTVANQWMWLKLFCDRNDNRSNMQVDISTDGETWTNVKMGYSWNDLPTTFPYLTYEQIGVGDSNNTIEIDLKEVKYYIDNVLSWEAVSF